jgi:glycosyltransferase involved in cell wall biosynthesis
LKNKVTVYIGLYNSEKNLHNVFNQLHSQNNQSFDLLVVDNNSSDQTLKKVSEWKLEYKTRLKIVHNATNLGAYGSLFQNLNRIKTPWFIWWHQDDFYKYNHIDTLIGLISKSNQKVVGVSTTMGSISSDGKHMNSYARPTWFTKNSSQVGQFIQNVKAQSIPDPASAFRVNVFKKTLIPVHSSSFPDTEHTLLMLGYGKFLISQKETMLYQENPNGISKTINQWERMFGATLGLVRVFHSNNFEKLLSLIDDKDRNKFAGRIVESLEIRFKTNKFLKQFLILTFLERLILEWGYDYAKISKLLQKNYSEFSSRLTLDTISGLSGLSGIPKAKNNKRIQIIDEKNVMNSLWNKYSMIQFPVLRRINKVLVKSLYRVLFIFKHKHRLRDRWD